MGRWGLVPYDRAVWDPWLEPPASVRDPVARRRARVLAAWLLLAGPLSVITVGGSALVLVAEGEPARALGAAVFAGVLVATATALYRAARAGAYEPVARLAVALTANMTAAQAVAQRVADPESAALAGAIGGLCLPALLSALLLGEAATRRWAAACTALALLLPAGVPDAAQLIGPAMLVPAVACLSLVVAVVFDRDLSALRDAHTKIVVQDRLASLGLLAAALNHEVKNPLTGVLANLELADRELGAGANPADTREMIGDALYGARQIEQLVRDVGKLARTTTEARPVDLRAAARTALAVSRGALARDARVVDACDPVPLVSANESMLVQVFLNLLMNAAQALPEGRPDNEVRLRTFVDADGAAVAEVRDNGTGIPAELLPRIFEARFTTKAPGEGTGLGLYVCRQIIGDLGGRIEVESTPGAGAAFRVRLPPVPGPA